MTKERHEQLMKSKDSRISNLESQLSRVRTELDSEKKEKTNLIAQLAAKGHELSRSAEQLTESAKEVTSLKSQLWVLEKQNSAVQATAEKLKNEKSELARINEKLEQRVKLVEKQKLDAVLELMDLKEFKIGNLKKQQLIARSELEQKLELLTGDNERLQKQIKLVEKLNKDVILELEQKT